MGIRIATIQQLVAEKYGVTVETITGRNKGRKYYRPRMIAAYLCWKIGNKSLKEIGRRFGGRNHTTMLHAKRKIEAQMLRNTIFFDEIIALEQEFLDISGNYLESRAVTVMEMRARALAELQVAASLEGAL